MFNWLLAKHEKRTFVLRVENTDATRPDFLEWFRDEAEREGRGYQTEINQALRNYIKQDKRTIQDIVREAVRKEIRVLKKAS